jgi:ABC-type lipoprotein export system ATPase subunit
MSNPSAPCAVLSQVTKLYPAADNQLQTVLKGVDLTIGAGETLSIVGSSGSGKSTLLNILGTLELPTSGSVQLFGKETSTLNENELSALRAERIGFIFQLHHLLPQLSALENVLVPTLALPRRDAAAAAKDRARELLKRVGLEQHLTKKPGQLSGGERQRVAVVRALINQPAMLLADEPTGALDETNAAALIDLLLELREETGVAVVLVSHDLTLANRMGRVLKLNSGVLQPAP